MLRWIWVVWVTICCLNFCAHTHARKVDAEDFTTDGEQSLGDATWKVKPQVKPTPSKIVVEEYVVVAGDTLGNIASHYGTTWEKLWELNRDRIVDPNLIYIGQRIRITGKAIPAPPPMTREEKIDKLARFMFKTSNLKFATKSDLEESLKLWRDSLSYNGNSYMNHQRLILTKYYETTRQYEIWLLTEAIIDASKDDEILYKMVGLAWQESHFVNQLGKHREVSFFQFLPSTVKSRFQLDDIGLEQKLWELSNNPKMAAELALEMMTEYKWNWLTWNGGIEFSYHVNKKIFNFKQEWRKR